MQGPLLFIPLSPDAKTLQPSPTATAVSLPAGTPPKPVLDEEGACTQAPESSTLKASETEPHPAHCECSACRSPTRLDTLESSENSLLATYLSDLSSGKKDAIQLDESSWAAKYRHSGWAEIRKKVFRSLTRCGETPTRRLAFANCGSHSEIWQSKVQERQVDGTYDNRYTVRCNCCHDRLCTPCANTRSFKIREALMRQVEKKRISFITLTLSGKGESLTELVDRLYRHFKALRNHPTWADAVTGGAAFIEIKYNDKARRWHPHLHIICEASFIPKQDLSDAWRSISKDSFIVDIQRVENAGKIGYYVTKYASKPLNSTFLADVEKMDEAVMALKGRRLCLTFGTWYGTPLTNSEDEELGNDLIDAGGYERTSISMNRLVEAYYQREEWARRIITRLDILAKFPTLDPPSG